MKRLPSDRRATYLVILENDVATADELRELGEYLSTIAVADLDVVVVDGSAQRIVERNRRVLRWVGRFVVPRAQHCTFSGELDPVRAAADLAACEKVIVADRHVRYNQEALDDVCALLELHEIVEPQDYFDPLPWWGGIDTGRMLLHRGIEPLSDRPTTFAFRKNAIRGLRGLDAVLPFNDPVRRLASLGGEVFSAIHVFVRRIPPMLDDWWRQRPFEADADLLMPAKTIFFLSLLPVMLLMAIFGGARVAGTYAGAIAFGALVLAVRGRAGAAPFVPWRACLYAPLSLAERSITIYWALLRRFRRLAEPHSPRRIYASAANPRSASASLS